MSLKALAELMVECVGFRCRHLVLDRDVWLPCLPVLRAKPCQEFRPQPGVNFLQRRAQDRVGNPAAEVPQPADFGCDHTISIGDPLEAFDNPSRNFARKSVKHRQVSAENIAIRREMRLSKAIEQFDILFCEPCSQNERVTGFLAAILALVWWCPTTPRAGWEIGSDCLCRRDLKIISLWVPVEFFTPHRCPTLAPLV